MNLKAHATHLIQVPRYLTEQIISQLKGPEEWFYQAHPAANHPLWIIGHLALADNMFIARFRPQKGHKPEGYEALFWFGTKPQPRSAYPPVEEVLAYFRERRQAMMQLIEELTDEELNAPVPPQGQRGPLTGAPNIGQVLLFAPVHEGTHLGQLTVAHRGLGYPPVLQM